MIPSDLSWGFLLVFILFLRGRVWYDALMPTIAQLEKLLTLDPNDPFVHYGLGQEHANVGEHDQAIVCYDKVLELDPEYLYAYFFKGQALHDLGRTDDAKLVIESGIKAAKGINDSHAAAELNGLLDTIT